MSRWSEGRMKVNLTKRSAEPLGQVFLEREQRLLLPLRQEVKVSRLSRQRRATPFPGRRDDVIVLVAIVTGVLHQTHTPYALS